MNCPKCGTQNEEGARFCEKCGTALGGSGNQFNQPSYNKSGGFDTKAIRYYFGGPKIWPIIVGLILFIIFRDNSVVKVLVVIAAIVAEGYFLLKNGNPAEVDRAWNHYAQVLSNRGLGKLDLLDEQTSLIEPVYIVGVGRTPDSSFLDAKLLDPSKKNIIRRIFRLKKLGTPDPEEKYRIGKDDILRSLLQQVTVFYFTESQVLRYEGNVDISTGVIYDETTTEVFYKDITGIVFKTELFKAFSIAKKRFVSEEREILNLSAANMDLASYMIVHGDDSPLSTQFAAMRNLIRDKKNE